MIQFPPIDIFACNQNQKEKKTRHLAKLVSFEDFFIYMFGGPFFKFYT